MNETTKLMLMNAVKALKHSYSPYSKYAVASCICTEDERLYTGVNVENSSYGLTVCAETSAIVQMVSNGQTLIKSLVILAGDNNLCSPCGGCRQRIYEFSNAQTMIYLCNKDTLLKSLSIDELLPLAFRL